MSHPPSIHFIGARGSGKSYAMTREARRRARCVIIDPTAGVTWFYTTRDPNQILPTLLAHPVADVCVHVAATREGMAEAVDAALDAAKRCPNWVTVAIDELAYADRETQDAIQIAGRTMRHPRFRFALLLASQRVVDARPDIRGILDLMVIFRVAGGTEYRALRELGGRQLEEAVRALPKYGAVSYHPGTGRWVTLTPAQVAAGDWQIEALDA